jgi:hypothetical protein
MNLHEFMSIYEAKNVEIQATCLNSRFLMHLNYILGQISLVESSY